MRKDKLLPKEERKDIYRDWHCKGCGQIKPSSEMCPDKRFICKKCHNRRRNILKVFDEGYKKRRSDYDKKWKRDNYEGNIKSKILFKKYRLTQDDIRQKLKDQNYLCDLCDLPLSEENVFVDHDHSCCPGKTSCGECVRGLVHSGCNLKEGALTDQIMKDVTEYRVKWSK